MSYISEIISYDTKCMYYLNTMIYVVDISLYVEMLHTTRLSDVLD